MTWLRTLGSRFESREHLDIVSGAFRLKCLFWGDGRR
jgi:hypothetical protein